MMSKFYQYDLPEYRPSAVTRAQKQGKSPRKKGKRRFIKWLIALALIAILIFFYFQRNVTRVLISISEATMRASTTIAVNDAVYYTLSDDMRYDDLVTVTRNDLGDIVGLSANSLKINKIARDTASISQSNLKNLSLNGIPVPLGALTGIEAFAGLGPSIHFRIIPVSSVSCGFSSSFESVGINQTKHSIYLNVIADISIVMPSRTENFAVVTDILVGESVIVGAIPDTYLQSDIFGNKPDLSP
ncbi:MAG: sporulation protein YunB [Clostridia bacterium]|nr:sporulation protein YunB [Clostridia bacterium]